MTLLSHSSTCTICIIIVCIVRKVLRARLSDALWPPRPLSRALITPLMYELYVGKHGETGIVVSAESDNTSR